MKYHGSLMLALLGLATMLNPARTLAVQGTSPSLHAVITADGVGVHSGPDNNSPVMGRIWQGVRVNVYQFQKGWFQIEVSSGERGWIRGDFVQTTAPEEEKEITGGPPEGMTQPGAESPYRIQVGDALAVKSIHNSEIDAGVTVRPDGCISLMYINDVYVAGMTPSELDKLLTSKYKKYFQSPEMTVIVNQSKEVVERRIYVGGEVQTPKEILLQSPTTVMQAIFASGGYLDTAKMQNILLIRRGEGNKALIYSLDLSKIEKGQGLENNVYLQPFDIVYIPPTAIAKADVFVKQYINKIIPERLTFGISWIPFSIPTK